ncbi:MAG: hypothetical protein IJ500_02215 [Alphaproteobacteria bacterium]|nr:hypothetical protein [Alphaproteobacteria bacterium]
MSSLSFCRLFAQLFAQLDAQLSADPLSLLNTHGAAATTRRTNRKNGNATYSRFSCREPDLTSTGIYTIT